ncbi:Uncharacterised protein [Bordetella pertussis]|nr:Uncharacterised protein [Bordetella pertussis]CPJ97285.1 Uncharacterised protein [Bordetella pertussis]
MTDIIGIVRPAPGRMARRHQAAAQRAAQHLGHDGQAVALVAAHLGGAAQRREAAFGALEDELHGGGRIGHAGARPVHRPAGRQGLAVVVVHLDLVGGHGGGSHVEQQRVVVGGGRAECDRVGAQHGAGAMGRHHDERGGAAGHQRHGAALHRQARVDAGRAEMMRIAHRHRAHAMLERLVDRHPHGLRRHRVAQAAHAVEQGAGRALAHQPRLRIDAQRAGAQLVLVGGQHGNAMRVDAQQIGLGHQVGRHASRRFGHAPRPQDAIDLLPHPAYRNHVRFHTALGHRTSPRCDFAGRPMRRDLPA